MMSSDQPHLLQGILSALTVDSECSMDSEMEPYYRGGV